jgi:hypothetical protein
LNNLTGLGGGVEWRATGQELPMVEDRLRESLATSIRSEIGCETEGFVDREVGLDGEQRCTWTLFLGEDMTTSSSEDTVDTTHGLLWYLNLDQEDGLENTWVGKESGGVEHTASSWDELTSTTMDSISMQSDINDVEAN